MPNAVKGRSTKRKVPKARSFQTTTGPHPSASSSRIRGEVRNALNALSLSPEQLAQAERLLRAYTLPVSEPPCRHADAYASRPTALSKPWAQLDAQFFNRTAVAAGYPSAFPIDTLLAILTHDPRQFLFMTDTRPARAKADSASTISAVYNAEFDPPQAGYAVRKNDWFDFAALAPDSTSTWAKFGDRYFPKQFEEGPGVWLDLPSSASSWNATQIVLQGEFSNTFKANNVYNFLVRLHTRGGYVDHEVDAQPLSDTDTLVLGLQAQNFNYGTAVGGYVTWKLLTQLDATATPVVDPQFNLIDVKYVQFCDGVTIYPLPGLSTNEGSVEELRLLGESLMFTNDAAPTMRAGKRAQFQSGGGVPVDVWFYPPTGTVFGQVAGAQGAVSEDLEEGAFSFRRPGALSDWDMIDLDGGQSNTGSGQGNVPQASRADYLVMAISAPPPRGWRDPDGPSWPPHVRRGRRVRDRGHLACHRRLGHGAAALRALHPSSAHHTPTSHQQVPSPEHRQGDHECAQGAQASRQDSTGRRCPRPARSRSALDGHASSTRLTRAHRVVVRAG
jgi:hypothetical protein